MTVEKFEYLDSLRREKKPCPACGRKGLRHPSHAHAYGWKDHNGITCRWCKRTWKCEPTPTSDSTPDSPKKP